jgi:hypothetical protein
MKTNEKQTIEFAVITSTQQTYEGQITMIGLKGILSNFILWLLADSLQKCKRRCKEPHYDAAVLSEDILESIKDFKKFCATNYHDIIDFNLSDVGMEITLQPCRLVQYPNEKLEDYNERLQESERIRKDILNSLRDKLEAPAPLRSVFKRSFYDLQRGCLSYEKAKAFDRDNDVNALLEIFADPHRWWEFRGWMSPYDRWP